MYIVCMQIVQFPVPNASVAAARKLTCVEKVQLTEALHDYWYTCGSSLQDLLLTIDASSRNTHILNKVYVGSIVSSLPKL